MGTTVRDLGVALRLVLHRGGDHARSEQRRRWRRRPGLVTLSAVSLHQWMKKIGPYLTVLLARMVESAAFSPEKWGGLHIIVGDATTVQRPASKGTTARVHYALRLADMTPRHIEVTDEHGGETARRFRAEPGEVWLLDRAYANPAGVARRSMTAGRTSSSATTAARFPSTTSRATASMSSRCCKRRRGEKTSARNAVVLVDGERISGRLCWVRLPVGKAVRRPARRARPRRATAPHDDALLAAEFVIVFTTSNT